MKENPMSDSGIFKAAIRLAPERRAAFLDQACGTNAELRQEVEALLRAHDASGSFLREPSARPRATIDDEPLAERPGTVIGPYKLMEQIGEGGMGLVFVAEQQQPVRRRVALKIIKPGMDSKQVIARFEAERQALAMMDHQNIAKVFDAGTTESGRPYFVMELVHGVPITDYCDANKLTPHERLELFIPVCQAIQHAHQKGIIHRDLKPSNILVTMYDDKPVPKVIDFGVAKAIEQRLTEKTVYTQFGTLVGTFEYMSPEQAEMNAFGVDTRSDIYALGVLLYELLTGTTPLERARLREAAFGEVVRLIKEEEPPRPSARLSTSGTLAKVAAARRTDPAQLSRLVRGELDWVVMRCLEKDRTRRYDTASVLARDVERYLRDEPVEACPPSAGYRLRKFARKHHKLLATAAAFLALLAVGAAVSAWQAVRATTAEREARAQRDAAQEAQATAEEQRQRAQAKEAAAVREADKARALAGMMQELLGTADPDAAKGPDYTVRQLLDDFEPALGRRLQGQPEADLRMTIGLAYRSMRLDAKAEQQLRRVLELRRQVFGPDHPKVAQTLTHLAWSLGLQRKHAEGEEQVSAAVAILRRLDDRSEDLANALRILARTHNAQQINLGAAEALYREALAVAERCAGGQPTPLVADITTDLAANLWSQERYAEGVALTTRSVALHRLVHGDKHPQTARGLWILGLCHHNLGQWADAECALREALTICLRAYGSQPHEAALGTLGSLLAVLDFQFKEEAADAVVRECLAAWQKPGLSLPEAKMLHRQRGVAALDRGDYAAAERHYRQALEAHRQSSVSLLDPLTIMLQYALGITLFLQDKTDEARTALQELVLPARTAAQKADVPPDSQTALAFALVVGGSGQAEDLQAARTLAQRAVERSEHASPSSRRRALDVLALIHVRSGDLDRALETVREAQSLVRNRTGLGGGVSLLLVQRLIEKGDRTAAEKVLRDGLKALQANLAKGHPEIAAAHVNLATFLMSQQRYADAAPLLRAAHESLKDHPQAAASASLKRRRAEVREQLARLYDAWGKPDEAAKWRPELEPQQEQKKQPGQQP
jgi:serine/threonine protein kinase/tetratricopeptide (TPR) repeat protein